MTKARRRAAAEALLGESVGDLVLMVRYHISLFVIAIVVGGIAGVSNLVLPSASGIVRYPIIGVTSAVALLAVSEARALAVSARGLTLLGLRRLDSTPVGVIRSVDPDEITIDQSRFTPRVSIADQVYQVGRTQMERIEHMVHRARTEAAEVGRRDVSA
jgi:hypothetical protein